MMLWKGIWNLCLNLLVSRGCQLSPDAGWSREVCLPSKEATSAGKPCKMALLSIRLLLFC